MKCANPEPRGCHEKKTETPVFQRKRRDFFCLQENKKNIFSAIKYFIILMIFSIFSHAFTEEHDKVETQHNLAGQPGVQSQKYQHSNNKRSNLYESNNDGTFDLESWINIAASLATIAALIVGGIWTYKLFLQRRQKHPHANLSHNIRHLPLENNKILLHVRVNVKNTGDILIGLRSGFTRILRIMPLSQELEELVCEEEYCATNGSCEIPWPEIMELESNWDEGECEIEPGEEDEICFDFILDANKDKVVEVYTYLKNVKKSDSGLGWNLTTVYDLRSQ